LHRRRSGAPLENRLVRRGRSPSDLKKRSNSLRVLSCRDVGR
jgi:hypothetical protein